MLRSLMIVLLAITATPALASSPAYPDAVQKEIKSMDDMCKQVGASPRPSENLVLSTDINHDGKADYALDQGAYVCDGAASLFGGTGGNGLAIFVSEPDGSYKQAWSGLSYGVKLGAELPAKIWLNVGGELCGQTGEVVHATMQNCTRALIWEERTAKVDFEPLSQAVHTQIE